MVITEQTGRKTGSQHTHEQLHNCKQKHGVIDMTRAYRLPGAKRCLGSWGSVPGPSGGCLLTVQW